MTLFDLLIKKEKNKIVMNNEGKKPAFTYVLTSNDNFGNIITQM